MHLRRIAAGALAGVALLGAMTGCAAPRTAEAPAADSSASSAPSAQGAGAAVDVCAMVPATELQAAMGADPGAGVAAKGRIDGGQCTWKASDTHTALAQFTREPDVYLPDGTWPRPDSASDVPGATRGFAAAETHTILVVKDGKGLLFNDVGLQDADQDAYEALAAAIAAKL